MTASEEIRKELKALEEDKGYLYELADAHDVVEFGTAYQQWYSRAYKVVESLAPERLDEFVSYYLIDTKRKRTDIRNYVVQDYIMGTGARRDSLNRPIWKPDRLVKVRVMNQMQIVASLSSRIESVLKDVTGHLFAEIQDSELAEATKLRKTSLRAAGALAGVVLERHLQRVALSHNIQINTKSPTISDLNDPLKQAGIYDVATWRKIQLLAAIRNLCSHQKSTEPTNEQVDELISGVDTVIKSVF